MSLIEAKSRSLADKLYVKEEVKRLERASKKEGTKKESHKKSHKVVKKLKAKK